ncbi:unnamed protein product [Kuraishia capsulata CBS 1993]|uniref:LST4 longin domain-containing protein n=1 Tax=Kuraishia capsulata CBS 1993 TaxID=1382522 RepID=W6MV34_9ASCO|nr:uncharacterized protein KUCA_T00005740001 [Kuraishia capsulata CBS 1993]CDK29747.1 unnamed protein product [Kuraishia capsulata CBS 1993]
MLNRMFARGSAPHQPITAAPLPSSAQSYEDTQTRTLLYGTPDLLPSSVRITERSGLFRLVIFQDGGMRSKHALFDSAVSVPTQAIPEGVSGSAGSIPVQPCQKFTKLDGNRYHPQRELMTHMFGHGVLVETSNSVKIHVLPPLPAMPDSILLTRLVSVDSHYCAQKDPGATPNDWHPQATIRSCQRDAPAANGSTRFGIGVVVPISTKDFDEVIADNWEEVADELAALQDLLLCKLQASMARSKTATSTSANAPQGMRFAPSSLQNDLELQTGLLSFIRMTIFLLETPRLLIGFNKADSALVDWAQTVGSWLEFKDGRQQHLQFLAALFTILAPMRMNLLHKPCDRSKPTYRVVIMTGNPMVSQKLILILTGLYTNEEISFVNHDREAAIPEPRVRPRPNSQTNSITAEKDMARPIPIGNYSHNQSKTQDSSPRSIRLHDRPVTTGWEIPSKTSPALSQSPVFIKTFESATNFDNAVGKPMINRQSSYASLQGISSSLTASTNLAQMSQSWMNHGFSFLDKWRSGQPPQPEMPKQPVSSASSSFSLKHSLSFSHLRTPSPAFEYEEYPWTISQHSPRKVPSMVDLMGTRGVPKPPQIRRGPSLIGSISEETTKQEPGTIVGKRYDEIRQRCRSIMLDDISLTSENGVVNVLFPHQIMALPQRKVLLPLCGYLEQFCPEFSMQSCPISGHLENAILDVMKDDVNRMDLSQPCFSKGSVITKTILVSLRAREINEFEIRVDDNCYRDGSVSNGAASPQISNLTSILQNSSLSSSSVSPTNFSPSSVDSWHTTSVKEGGSSQPLTIKPRTRRLFCPNRKYQYLDRFHVSKVDDILNRIADLARRANEENEADVAKRIRNLVDDLIDAK